MGVTRAHWDQVYATWAETAVSWYQPHARRSLQFIRSAASSRSASIIDVGGGASTLADDLLAEGNGDITVLDISEAALARSKGRLGGKASQITWLLADVTEWKPPRTWAIRHDRAVFHFFTERTQQDAYIAALKAATRNGATIIIATFALDGPDKCSGLPVQHYSPFTLADRLGSDFVLAGDADETHVTPSGSEQRFSYAVLTRVR
jgi:hypothetical protein